jgi:drug/metabolite transporter (DMT)-like permease
MKIPHVYSLSATWPSLRTDAFRVLWRKMLLIGVPVVANVLYASFAMAHTALQRIDPIIFVALQMGLLLPVAFVFFMRARRPLVPSVMRQGMIAGILLGLGFLGVALSLRTIGIIRAAALTSCDGIIASLIARWILRQRQSFATGLACILAGVGVFLLWLISPGVWQADILALIVGCLFCLYALSLEQTRLLEQTGQEWAFFGMMFVTMAAIAFVAALCFGSWNSLRTFSLPDLGLLFYTSWAALLLPIVINTLLLRKLSAISLSFLAMLEPLASIGFAWWQGEIAMTVLGWLGVGSIVVSILVQVYPSSQQQRGTGTKKHIEQNEIQELFKENRDEKIHRKGRENEHGPVRCRPDATLH